MVVNNPHDIRIGDIVKNKYSKEKVKEMGGGSHVDAGYYDLIQNNTWKVISYYVISLTIGFNTMVDIEMEVNPNSIYSKRQRMTICKHLLRRA